MTYARIIGTGGYLPEKVLTNAELEKMVETTDAWIIERTGIKKRHIAAESETTCDLAEHAARRALAAAGVEHVYLEYGNYFGHWRRRNALKMWSGWPTFPMVFVKGVLVGGAAELERLIASGELERLLG